MSKVNVPEPITRKELFLAAAGGKDIELPEALTREECYLKAIAEKVNGGVGGTAVKSTGATAGQFLTADGDGGSAWQTVPAAESEEV